MARIHLEVDLRPQPEEERRSGLELSGVHRLDVQRQGEPTGDRRVVVELEALLVVDRRDRPECLSKDAAGTQVVIAQSERVRGAAGKWALAPDVEVQELVHWIG
jgi:hypothetical protein